MLEINFNLLRATDVMLISLHSEVSAFHLTYQWQSGLIGHTAEKCKEQTNQTLSHNGCSASISLESCNLRGLLNCVSDYYD